MMYIVDDERNVRLNCCTKSAIPFQRHMRGFYIPLCTLLKGLAQAKIIKKSVILFWFLIMTI